VYRSAPGAELDDDSLLLSPPWSLNVVAVERSQFDPQLKRRLTDLPSTVAYHPIEQQTTVVLAILRLLFRQLEKLGRELQSLRDVLVTIHINS